MGLGFEVGNFVSRSGGSPPSPPLSTTAASMPRGVKSAQSTSKEAQYQQRKSLVQRELSNATRLFARQLHRATNGAERTLPTLCQRCANACQLVPTLCQRRANACQQLGAAWGSSRQLGAARGSLQQLGQLGAAWGSSGQLEAAWGSSERGVRTSRQ